MPDFLPIAALLCLPFLLVVRISASSKRSPVTLWLPVVISAVLAILSYAGGGFGGMIGAMLLGGGAGIGAMGVAVGLYYRHLRKENASLWKYWLPPTPFFLLTLLGSLFKPKGIRPGELMTSSMSFINTFHEIAWIFPFALVCTALAALVTTIFAWRKRRKTSPPAPPEKEQL
jgi:hypothetical protein